MSKQPIEIKVPGISERCEIEIGLDDMSTIREAIKKDDSLEGKIHSILHGEAIYLNFSQCFMR